MGRKSHMKYVPGEGFRFAGHKPGHNDDVSGPEKSLAAIVEYAEAIESMVDAESELPDWVEHKLSVARVHLGDIMHYIEDHIEKQQAEAGDGVRFSG